MTAPTPLAHAVPDLAGLLAAVRAEATHLTSVLHGEQHWQAVARSGLHLLGQGVPAAPAVEFLFAVCHDAMRESDGWDPRHGWRGARLAERLTEAEHIRLRDRELAALVTACETHTGADPTDDPTVGTCYDADRLNLWRVGQEPAPALLSTAPARLRETIAAAAPLCVQPADWHELASGYAALHVRR